MMSSRFGRTARVPSVSHPLPAIPQQAGGSKSRAPSITVNFLACAHLEFVPALTGMTDVHAASVHVNMGRGGQSAATAAVTWRNQAVNHVVQPALQLLQEQFAGDTGLPPAFSK